MSKFKEYLNEKKVEKIACLECDEVSTKKAWEKNRGFCPKCKKSSRGVLEEQIEHTHRFLGDVNKSMGNLLNSIENAIENAYSYPDASTPKNIVEKRYKNFTSKLNYIDKTWKGLQGDIATLIRVLMNVSK